MYQAFVKDRLRLLLDQLGRMGNPREPCKVKFSLREVRFLATSASIADCENCNEIANWSNERLAFLRQYGEFSPPSRTILSLP